jgi:hypothetical protein
MFDLLGQHGVRGYRATDLTEDREVEVSRNAADTIRALLPVRRSFQGSIEGNLETISVHRERKFMVYHAVSRKAVTCQFASDVMLREAFDALGTKVMVSGMVHSNIKGEPHRVTVEALRTLGGDALPTTRELAGSDPDFTGELTTDEYLRTIRRG